MEEKENKQAPRERREKFMILLYGFLWATANMYPSEIPTQTPGTLTYTLVWVDLASESTGPSSSLSSRLSLTVASLRLLLTAFFRSLLCFLHHPETLLSLVFFRSFRQSSAKGLCVSFAPKQTKGFSDWHPHPHPQKRMLPILPQYKDDLALNNRQWLICHKIKLNLIKPKVI